jgi:hypothetical protein
MGQLRIRYVAPPGNPNWLISIERLADGAFVANDGVTFGLPSAWPPPTEPLPELSPGRYGMNLVTTTWADGEYLVYVHPKAAPQLVVAQMSATIRLGDDSPAFPPHSFSITGTT